MLRTAGKNLLLLLAPFAPHFCEELWERLGYEYSIFNQSFPECDESALTLSTVNMALQLNGKVRANFDVPADFTAQQIEEFVRSSAEFAPLFEGKEIKKAIVVPGRIANFVVV